MPNHPYIIRDPARGSFHFLRFSPLTRRWDPDLTIPGNIRSARTRLYHLVNPPPYYSEYQYATVDDDATLTLMYELRDPSVVSDFSDIRTAGAGLHRDYVRDTADPPTEDRTFRERRATTLDSIEPPDDGMEDLTPLQRVAQLLLAAGDHTRPAPLTVPRTPLWSRRADTTLLRALFRHQGDDAQAAAWAGGGGGAAAAADPGLAWGGDAAPLSFWDRWREPQTQTQAAPAPAVDAPRRNIADAMIRDAISQKAQCPISMEPITQDTAACVAPCYHVFCRESIAQWLERETTCPTCREPCRM
jgi:hypothetical protein